MSCPSEFVFLWIFQCLQNSGKKTLCMYVCMYIHTNTFLRKIRAPNDSLYQGPQKTLGHWCYLAVSDAAQDTVQFLILKKVSCQQVSIIHAFLLFCLWQQNTFSQSWIATFEEKALFHYLKYFSLDFYENNPQWSYI